MSFKPKLHRVTALTKSQARKKAREAVADLTEAQARELESALRIRVSSVKQLNRKMCLRVIEWVKAQEFSQ